MSAQSWHISSINSLRRAMNDAVSRQTSAQSISSAIQRVIMGCAICSQATAQLSQASAHCLHEAMQTFKSTSVMRILHRDMPKNRSWKRSRALPCSSKSKNSASGPPAAFKAVSHPSRRLQAFHGSVCFFPYCRPWKADFAAARCQRPG